LLELLDPYDIFAGIWESHSLYSMILFRAFPFKRDSGGREKVNGTRSARIELVEDRHEIYDRLHEAVEKRWTAVQIGA
jgi:hypothetical protein